MTYSIGYHTTGFERNCPTDGSGQILGEYFGFAGVPSPNDVVLDVTDECAHTGNYSLKISGTTIDDWASLYWYLNARRKVKVSFWYKPSLIYGSRDETCIFTIRDDVSKYPVKIYWDESGTFYGVHNVEGMMGSIGGFPADEWVHVGIIYFNHTLHGRFGLWINGKEAFWFSGRTNSSTYRDLLYFYFGSYPYDVSRNQGTPIGAYYDDIKYEMGLWNDDDEIPTDSRLLDIVPNGDGYYAEWAQSPETPPLTTLYDAVDDVQPSTDTPNIKAWENSQPALFAMQDITVLDGLDVPTVLVKYSAKRNTHSSPYLYLNTGIRTNSVDSFGDAMSIGTSWTVFMRQCILDAQNNSWTESSVNATEMGIRTVP